MPGTADDTFTLNDGGVKTINNVPAGTYHVSENDPTPGYDLTNLTCTDPDNGSSVSLNSRQATIDVDPNETVHCTFTNRKRGKIEIEKQYHSRRRHPTPALPFTTSGTSDDPSRSTTTT